MIITGSSSAFCKHRFYLERVCEVNAHISPLFLFLSMLFDRNGAGRSFSVLTRGEGAIPSLLRFHGVSHFLSFIKRDVGISVQSAGEDRAGDLEGDGDLVRHLSHETRGAIAGLQVLWLFTINGLGDSGCEMIDEGRQTILSPPPPRDCMKGDEAETKKIGGSVNLMVSRGCHRAPETKSCTCVKRLTVVSPLYFTHTRTFTNQR